jgi:hypothetical protein
MGFFDAFTGSQQRKDLKRGYADSKEMLREGYDQGRADISGYGDKAQGYLDPYLKGGGQANALLGNYLGANGADAQREAFAAFQNDPGFQQQLGAGINALDRSATARGGLYSGAAMKGVAEYGQQFQRQAFNDRINQLGGYAGQGQQAAMGAAGLASQTGGQLGNMAFGFGQQNAANRINFANGMANSASIGPQNFLNLAGSVAKAMSGIPGMK